VATQKERARRHYLENKDKYLERARRQRKYAKVKLKPEQLILERTKASAKARGLEFNLDLNDIVIPETCPYTGLALQFNEGRPKKNSYSVDRIDNSKGYVKGNVEIISYMANVMKQNSTEEEQIRFAKEILRRYEIS
jgi:hypothetical protein